MFQRLQVLEGIARGELAVRDGRTMSNAKAKEKMHKWLKYSGQSQLLMTLMK